MSFGPQSARVNASFPRLGSHRDEGRCANACTQKRSFASHAIERRPTCHLLSLWSGTWQSSRPNAREGLKGRHRLLASLDDLIDGDKLTVMAVITEGTKRTAALLLLLAMSSSAISLI